MTTVPTTLTLVTETTGQVTSARPKSACTGIARTAWNATTVESMTVPAFHDRWPLRSTT